MAVLATSTIAYAEPSLPLTRVSIVAQDDLALHLDEHTASEAASYKPHKWLSNTIKNMNIDLVERDLALGLAFDARSRRAQIRLAGIDTDIKFHKGRATLNTTVDLQIGSSRYNWRLPEVSLIPKSHKGRRYVEYQIPIIRGNLDDVIEGITDPVALMERLRFF